MEKKLSPSYVDIWQNEYNIVKLKNKIKKNKIKMAKKFFLANWFILIGG